MLTWHSLRRHHVASISLLLQRPRQEMFRNTIHIGIYLRRSINIISKDIALINATLLALDIMPELIHFLLKKRVVLFGCTTSAHG